MLGAGAFVAPCCRRKCVYDLTGAFQFLDRHLFRIAEVDRRTLFEAFDHGDVGLPVRILRDLADSLEVCVLIFPRSCSAAAASGATLWLPGNFALAAVTTPSLSAQDG